jgi:hypothetical protein
VQHRHEVDGAAVVSGRDAAEMLELVDAALDAVAQFVEPTIKSVDANAPRVGGDDSLCADGVNGLAESLAVIGGVGDDGLRFLLVYQGWRGDQVMNLPAGERKAQRSAERVDEQMDLRR